MRSLPVFALTIGCASGVGNTDKQAFPASEGTDWFAPVAAPIAGEWPQYRLEVQHRGVAPEGTSIGRSPLHAWQSEAFAIGDYSASKTSPTLSDDLVFVGIDDGHLLALDRDTGEEVWRFRTHRADTEDENTENTDHQGIHGTAAVHGDRVWIGDYNGWLYALDHDTGALIWEQDLGGSIGASPVYYQGHIFMAVEFPDPDGRVYVVDAETGGLWYETPPLGNHPHSSVSIDPDRGTMFIGANNGHFVAFDFVNREMVWEAWMDEKPDGTGLGDIKTTAAVDGDTVYVSSWDQKVHAFDIDTGERLWSYETLQRVMSSPSVYEDTLFMGSHDGYLYALDIDPSLSDEDRLRWRTSLGATSTSSPTVVPEDGLVFIGDHNGDTNAVDMATGEIVWSARMAGRVSGVPTLTGNSLFAFDSTGVTWRFDAE